MPGVFPLISDRPAHLRPQGVTGPLALGGLLSGLASRPLLRVKLPPTLYEYTT